MENLEALEKAGWRVLTIWECALKGRTSFSADEVADKASTWLVSGRNRAEIAGKADALSMRSAGR